VNYEFAIPDPVHDYLESLGLEFEIIDGFYEDLEKGVTQEQVANMRRFTMATTRIHYVEIPDPINPVISHHFTLWLEHGPDHQLTVHQCEYKLWNELEHDSTAFDGDGNPV
jgi:hypothetical protein